MSKKNKNGLGIKYGENGEVQHTNLTYQDGKSPGNYIQLRSLNDLRLSPVIEQKFCSEDEEHSSHLWYRVSQDGFGGHEVFLFDCVGPPWDGPSMFEEDISEVDIEDYIGGVIKSLKDSLEYWEERLEKETSK